MIAAWEMAEREGFGFSTLAAANLLIWLACASRARKQMYSLFVLVQSVIRNQARAPSDAVKLEAALRRSPVAGGYRVIYYLSADALTIQAVLFDEGAE